MVKYTQIIFWSLSVWQIFTLHIEIFKNTKTFLKCFWMKYLNGKIQTYLTICRCSFEKVAKRNTEHKINGLILWLSFKILMQFYRPSQTLYKFEWKLPRFLEDICKKPCFWSVFNHLLLLGFCEFANIFFYQMLKNVGLSFKMPIGDPFFSSIQSNPP